MIIATIANVHDLPALETVKRHGLAATALPSIGYAAPWPVEAGVTLMFAAPNESAPAWRAAVLACIRNICETAGEECAAVIDIPSTLDFVYASNERK